MLKYIFHETPEIRKLLIELEALKIVFGNLKPLPHIEENLRRESILKSALYSARVEGNPLTLEEVRKFSEFGATREIRKLEVNNLLRAHKFIYSKVVPKGVTKRLILKLHKIIMRNISPDAGKFRHEPWGIFNTAGVAVYLAPAHFKVQSLIDELVSISNKKGINNLIKAAIVQFLFEKIHPFADGNGRVGRLLSSFILAKGDYRYRGVVSFEEYVDENRELYYDVLMPSKNATGFVEFFLQGLKNKAGEVLVKLSEKNEELPQDKLLPRRKELYEIIKDHPFCAFEFLKRRFINVNPKTLHYDIKKLQDEGFIIKLGATRGVVYKTR